MSQVFSYLDTTLRVINLNIRQNISDSTLEKYKQSVEDEFSKHHKIKRALIQSYIKDQKEGNNDIQFLLNHETHHYWQSIFYPCLFFLSYLEFKSFCEATQSIRASASEEDASNIRLADLRFDRVVNLNIEYTSIKFKLCKNDQFFSVISDLHEDELYNSDVFSLNDLIEDATTLYMYKVFEKEGSASSFFKWIKNPENRGHKRLIQFIGKTINEDFAYKMLLPIVQLSFYTTEPISAFNNLLNYANMYALEHPLWSFESAFAQMKEFLNENYTRVDSQIVSDHSITDRKTGLIDTSIYESIVRQQFGFYFPLKMHALKYLELLKTNESLEMYLCNPNQESHSYLKSTFEPYAVFYNFQGIKTSSNAMVISKEFSEYQTAEFREVSPETYLFGMLRIREVTFSLLADYNLTSPHNCYHTGCKYYDLQVCRKWNAIPENHSECEFPQWFKFVYHYEIDCDSKELRKLKTEVDTMEKEYYALLEEKSKKKMYNYTTSEDADKTIFILTIPKDVVVNGNCDFIVNFINWIQKTKRIPAIDLIDSILLDYPDYLSDPRYLYDIPEIKALLKQLFSQYNWVLGLLNFSSVDRNQAFIIIPIFAEIEKVSEQGESLLYRVKPDDAKEFIYTYYKAVIAFCERNQIDPNIIRKLKPSFI